MIPYSQFLESKARSHQESGFIPGELPSSLFQFQRDIVIWGCKKGKAAIFAGTGLGKTIISLSWADQVVKFTGKPVLILAPLAVAPQTRDEGVKFGIPVNLCRSQADVKPGINITNYEILDKFDCSGFAGIGSTLYQALTMNRHAYGIELKESYYEQAVENCKRAEKNAKTPQFTLESFTEAKQAVLS